MNKYSVLIGNPMDGMTLRGIFDDYQEACEWADFNLQESEWWVVIIYPKDKVSQPPEE